MKSRMQKYTIQDFNKQFPNDDACLEWIKNHFYPNGIYCPLCQMITRHHRMTTRRSYSCDRCGHHVHPTAGTIFEKSKVEVDECYMGGYRHGKRGRGAEGKMPVLGIAQRNGELSANAVKDVKRATLIPVVKERVLPDSMVYTDELHSYDKLYQYGYNHKRVHHSAKVWVLGNAHTNTVEGFWSLLKRGVNGVYHAVSQKYLQSYINEYSFRYNHRKDEQPMFLTILKKV